ncbi:hypothetical protein ACIQXA_03170 [Streptomyces massasporeus]|uniref:hypothetical protein n=1 Tax=Streptomyces massasporeus TaxID=67324 RepID=UPI0037FE6CBF
MTALDVYDHGIPAESRFGYAQAIRSGDLVHVSGQQRDAQPLPRRPTARRLPAGGGEAAGQTRYEGKGGEEPEAALDARGAHLHSIGIKRNTPFNRVILPSETAKSHTE